MQRRTNSGVLWQCSKLVPFKMIVRTFLMHPRIKQLKLCYDIIIFIILITFMSVLKYSKSRWNCKWKIHINDVVVVPVIVVAIKILLRVMKLPFHFSDTTWDMNWNLQVTHSSFLTQICWKCYSYQVALRIVGNDHEKCEWVSRSVMFL